MSLLTDISREDLEDLRAINASFTGKNFFSSGDEEAIKPVIYTQRLLDEWVRREDVCTLNDFWQIAKAGERASLMWAHDGVSLTLSTCGMVAEREGVVRVGTCDLRVTAPGAKYLQPPFSRLVFSMHDLRIPQELLQHLETVL